MPAPPFPNPGTMTPFDATSRVLLMVAAGNRIDSCTIAWKTRRDNKIIWTVHLFCTPVSTSTTFPIGTGLAQVQDWAKKFEAVIGKVVTVVP